MLLNQAVSNLHAQREQLERRVFESSRDLEGAKNRELDKQEAVYLAKIAEKFPVRKITVSSLEAANEENAFLNEKLGILEKREKRKRTNAILLCHAVEELRIDLESEISTKTTAESFSSNISDISIA